MSVYIVDTECTGLDDPEVIELGRLKIKQPVDDGLIPTPLIGEPFVQRFCPSKPCTFGALAIHHILPDEVIDCVPSADAKLPDDCEYMIGHSCDFDWQALGCPNVLRICTRGMVEHCWPDADSFSQSAMLYRLLGPTEATRERLKGAHDALVDAENNLELLRCILRAKPEIDTWEALWEFSEECRIPLKLPITQQRGTLLTDVDDGLLDWLLNQHWLPGEHPYLHKGLLREYQRRQEDELPF